MCDIDHFKKVNDTYGHQAGDQVLKIFTQSIQEWIRDNIDWLTRYGGEEFIIVVPETDFKGACSMSNRLRQGLSKKTIKALQNEIQITASFGVTCINLDTPDEKVSLEAMINQADKYLYKAKQKGRNRVKGRVL
jgi:diguanylate cyclase (GGDEF)-like protein